MKTFFLLLVLTASLFLPLHAQPNVPISDVYQLGTKQVRVPVPEGFINSATRYDRVVERLYLSEDPRNETIASFVHQSLIPKLDLNQNVDIPLYAKFSVVRSVMAVDCSPENFAQTVKVSKSLNAVFLDPDSKLHKDQEASLSKNLGEVWGTDKQARLVDQKDLGYFQDANGLFSALSATNLQVDGKTFPMVYSTSLVLVNKRLLLLTVYRMGSTKEDVDTIIDVTKKWTAAVIEANKPSKPELKGVG